MKQKDLVLILVVAAVAAIFSLILTQTLFVSKESKEMTAEVVEPINSTFNEPDPKVFNEKAINPTQLIQIGDTNNPNPF